MAHSEIHYMANRHEDTQRLVHSHAEALDMADRIYVTTST